MKMNIEWWGMEMNTECIGMKMNTECIGMEMNTEWRGMEMNIEWRGMEISVLLSLWDREPQNNRVWYWALLKVADIITIPIGQAKTITWRKGGFNTKGVFR